MYQSCHNFLTKTESTELNLAGRESITDELDGLNDKRGVRKRKKEDEEEEMNTSLELTEIDTAAGKKKKTEELVHHLTRPLLSTSQQSLQKTIVTSITNPITNFQPSISVSSINSGTVVTSSKLIFTMAQPTTTNINNVTSNKPPQFLLLTNNQGSSTLLQQLPVFPTAQINKPPISSGFIQQVPVPVPIMPPQVAMVANKTSSSGGVCLLNNQLALDHNLVSVNANKYSTDNKVELVDSSRPVLSSLLAAPPDFSPYPDRESSMASENSSYPVTPPRTPDDQQSEADSVVSAQSGPTPPDKDIIPLCCCKINGASFKKLGSSVTYCQALDSIDGKVMGCCNKVTNYQLVRPGVKIPFMAVCEAHRKRLRLHQCCPGCGHFCTQGKFNQCKKDNSVSVHHFHHECQVIRDSKHYCPHCGEVSGQVEVTLTLEQPRNSTVFEDKCSRGSSNRARMGPNKPSLSKDKENTEDLATVSYKLSDKTISTGGIPLGPDKYSLERVLNGLTEDRPRKYKAKCLYNPAYEGDLERVVYMLADGFSPNEIIEDFDNQTPLHAAALSGNLAIVHVLVQAGGNIHTVDKELKTPLMYAAENNHLEVTKYLLKAGAQVDTRAEDGMTVLHYASKAGHVDIVKCLLDTDDIKIDVQD
ncbi:hypothetical protein KUTeg_022072 [Tegillarca granosa]|uniref:EHMT1/2 cysteine-rich region domain-containing protein n=1 Tax=Tegillarca granosa TaxID=220873 RepID=A0ABQ9EBC0_TEGGR|nr:hypothetical protein KUTeg_022072 [Tegillarca granosa]